MGNLDKITTYLKDNHVLLDNLTPTMVHNVLSENESITINEWRNLGPEELERLDQLDDGKYNPTVKRGDKVMVVRLHTSPNNITTKNGSQVFSMGHYGWVDMMEARSALDFAELEVITDHSDHRTKPIPEYGTGWSKETLEWQRQQDPTLGTTYALYAKVMVTDPENKFYKAEFRLDPEYVTWIKVEDDIDKEIYHDIELDEDLVNWSYNGDEIGVIKETLQANNEQDIAELKRKNIINMTMIPTSKRLAAEVIDGVLKAHKYGPYLVGDTINLEQETLNGPDGYDFENRLRFDILRESLSLDKEGRGFSFEGIIAGFFGGQPAQAGLKEDIYIDGLPISVKQSNAVMNGTADAWDTGSLLGKELSGEINSGYNLVKKQIEDAGLEVPTELDETTGETKYGGKVKKNLSAFETPYALLVAGKEYDVYKRRMLETVFTSSKGIPLHWIFAGIKKNGDIKYRYMSSDELIDGILNVANIHEVIGLGRNRENGFRIKSKPILTQESTSEIILPEVTEKELIEATYEEEGEKLIDRIANLFGDKASRVNRKAINYIKDNPTEFLDRLKVLMPELERLTRDDVNEATKRVNMLIIESIKDSINFREKKMRDRVHWWWDNEGFTLDQDILKVMGVGPNDYYDVRREALAYLGGLEGLSEKIYDDLTVGMEQINYGDHTIKYTIDDIEFYMTPGGLAHVDVEISVDPDGKLDIMGMDDNVHTYTLEDLSWYPAPEDETKVSDESADAIYEDLQDSIMVALSDKYFNKYGIDLGGVHVALGKDDFYDLRPTKMNHIGRYTDKSYQLREDSDIFGQGLLEPIEYGEYDNDEDWEKDVRNVDVDDKGEPLPTERETSPEDMYVSPTKDLANNICNSEGFCSDQGPITFGQLKSLIDTATSKRLGSDIARGGFKTIWRLVPFFLPQLLLVSAGVTITRAINKIITPALKDTRGHKSWWGKAVLKAMDIAEGDYIPDKTLGDDPLSKIFFISDGLLTMLKDKYKLKFARYVAAVAASKPDNEIVPEWFVDDLLRDYLNQKFLLDPPLQTRTEFKKNYIKEGNIGRIIVEEVPFRVNKWDNIIKESNVEGPKQNPEVDYGDTIMFTYIHPNFKELNGIQTMEPYVVEEESVIMKDKYTTSNIEKYIEHVRFVVKKERQPDNLRYAVGKDEISRLSYYVPDGTPTKWVSPEYHRWIKLDDVTAQKLMESPKDRSLQSTLLETLKEEFIETITPITKEMTAFCYGWYEYLPEKYHHLRSEITSGIRSDEDDERDRFMCEEADDTLYNLSVEVENWLAKFGVNVRELDTVNEEMRQWYANIYNGIDNRLTSNELGIPTPIDSDNQHLIYNNDVKEPAWYRKVNIKEDRFGHPNNDNSVLSNIITENKYELLKIVVNDIGWDGVQRLEPTVEEFKDILRNFLKIHEIKRQGIIWLTLRWNTTQAGQEFNDSIIETLKNVEYKDLQVPPKFWDIDVYYSGYVEENEEQEWCDDDGYGEDTGDECECERWETIVVEDDDGLEDSAPCNEAEDYFTQKQLESIEFDEDSCECEDYYAQYYIQKSQNTDTANFLATELDNVPNLETTKTTHFMEDEFEYSQVSELGYWELSRDEHHQTDYYDEYDSPEEDEITEIYTSEFHLTGPQGVIKESSTRLRSKWVIVESNGAYPFDRKDIALMKMIHNEFDKDTLEKLSNPTQLYGQDEHQNHYIQILKIFGYARNKEKHHDPELIKPRARFAKWVLDNWNEEGDYENLEHPEKTELKWYRGTLESSGDQTEYRSGEIDVLGWDEEDATDEIANNFWDWGGEQETYDYGDYNEYDSDVENVHLIDESVKRILEKNIRGNEEMVVGDRVMLVNMDDPFAVTPYTIGTVTEVQPNDPATSPNMNGQDTKTSYNVAWDGFDGGTMKLLGGIDRWLKIDDDTLEDINSGTQPSGPFASTLNPGIRYNEYRPLDENFVIDKSAGLSPDLKAGDDIIIVRNTTGVDIPLYTEFEVLKQKRDNRLLARNADMLYIADSTRYPSGGRGSTFLALTKNDDPNNYEHKDRFRRDKISWLKVTKDDTVLNEHLTTKDGYNDTDVQTIVDRVYPHIVKNLGPSKYVNQPPTVELWNDIYARLSGIPEMKGEESSTSKSEHDDYGNVIYIYYPNMEDVEDIIKALLHEYTHSLQDPDKREENRALGYDNDPDEIESRAAELNWKEYLQYVRDNLIESKKESKLNPELIVGDEIWVVHLSPTSKIEHGGNIDSLSKMLPKLYTSYVVTQVKQNNNTQETYYGLQPADITDYAKVGLTQEEKWELLYDFLDQRAMEGDEYAERLINEEGYDILYWDLYDFADEKMVEGNEEASRVLEKVNMRLLNLFQDDRWILRPGFKRGELNEHEESKESRLNPDLIVGDEILVVSTDKNHSVNAPELYIPYVVTAKEYQTLPYTRDKIQTYRLDMVDPPDGRTWREHNIRIKDLYLHPEEDKWIFNPGFKNYLRGETIVETVREEDEELQSSFKKWQTHNEYKESRLSPELDEGDTILVIDRDKERESGKTKYTTPAKELRPERYVPYVVIYKETAGSKSPWPFKYILIPEDRHQDYLDDPYSKEVEEIQKLLFPWIYQWIHSDTPMATNVDRKTIQQQRKLGIISEHEESKKSKLSPKLKIGDEILVVRVGDADIRVENKPDRYIPYFVTEIYHGDELHRVPFNQTYYGLDRPDIDVTDTERLSLDDVDLTTIYLFPGYDTWIFNPEGPTMRSRTISEHKESRLNPQLMVGDEILVVSSKGIHDFGSPELYEPYVVVGIKYGHASISYNKPFYQIEPLGMTDEERTGAMLAGGGRMKPLYIFSPDDGHSGSDQWVLNPGFRRGELNEEDGYVNDMVYIDEPREKHIKRMGKDLGAFDNFPINNFMNIPPPENESDTTEDEIEQIEEIPVDNKFVDTTDNIHTHFKRFLKSKNLEYPEDEIEEILSSIGIIILKLKYHYNRPRPQQVAAAKELELNPTTLDSASTPSYPSGHATQGRFIARYLSDIYPDYHDELIRVGDEVGDGRLMAKVHYPSDQAFGKLLGDNLYDFSIKQSINESVPQPGKSSAEGFDDKNLPYETEYLTLDEILSRVENIAYYREVLRDLQDDKEDWEVTQTVKRYADYWMEYPESLTSDDFPPIQVIGNGMKDGSHRVSTLNALANHIDPENFYWKDVELEVRFYDPKTVMESGHYYPWLWDISDEDLQQAIDDKVYNWEVLEKWLADPNAKSDLEKLRAESLSNHKNKQLNEQKETQLNPELEEGDIIKVINVDGEHDKMPERYIDYIVIIKTGSNFGDGTHAGFWYDIVPYPKTDLPNTNYMAHIVGHYGDPRAKRLYRGDKWIRSWKEETPKNINEHKETKLNPELEEGDIIKVVALDGEREDMPNRWENYRVMTKVSSHLSDDRYEIISTIDDEKNKELGYLPNTHQIKRIYADDDWGDKWILSWKGEKESLQEHKESRVNPELKLGDEIIVVHLTKNHYNFDITWPELYKPYVVVKIKHPNKYQPSNAQTYYELIPAHTEGIDYSFKKGETTVTGIDLRGPGVKRIYPTDKWIFNPGFLNEHEESRLSPELEVGDNIIVIGVDADVESNIVKYNVPPISYRPERYIPYTVVEKKTTGGKSKWPFNYILIETDKYQDYLSGNYMISKDSAKLLFPWIYKWISVDTPMETNVDRKTISEQKETQLNPELYVGDVIKVINIGNDHARMPERFTDYKVYDIRQDNATQEIYYALLPHPQIDVKQTDESYDDSYRRNYIWLQHTFLYPEDTWIRSWKEEIPKYIQEHNFGHGLSDTKHSPELEVDDVIMVIKTKGGPYSFSAEIGVEYKVIEIGGSQVSDDVSGSKANYRKYYELVPTDVNCEGLMKCDYQSKIKRIYQGDDRWVKLHKEGNENLNEHKETQLNPELEIGDVIKIIDVDDDDKSPDAPERWEDYKVIRKGYYRQRENWEGPELNRAWYEIIPNDNPTFSDGSSRVKRVYWKDKWIRIWKGEKESLQEQMSFMDKSDQAMERARKEALRRGLFNSLNTLFDVLPYEEGEIVHNDVNMGVYNKETGQFVPVDYIYDPIMENMGMQVTEDDLQLFIDIITEWVNMRMSSHNIEEYVN